MSFPPGPSETALVQTWRWVRDPVGFLVEMSDRYGHGTPFTMRRIGGMKLMIVSDPEHVKQVFLDTDTYLAGKSQEQIKRFIGEHTLFGLDGDVHKRHRRLLLPPFQGERMRAYGELMRDLTLEEIKRWPKDETFLFSEPMTRVTLDVIFHAVFGLTDPKITARLNVLLQELTGGGRAMLAYLPFLQVNLGSWSPYGRFLKTQAEFDGILFDAIAAARDAPEGREDILARLIVEGQASDDPFTDQELRDELVTLLGAGHETTASGLSWAMQSILSTEHALQGILAELKEVLGGESLEASHIGQLKYLKAAVCESMRLTPPIPNCGRWVAKETELAGYTLPVGSYVTPCPYLTHRNPDLYPEPDAFKPERFLGKKRSPWEYYPFGGGKRLCIGMNFAIYEMTVILATIFSTVTLELDGPPSLAAKRKAILVVPRNGTPVRLRR